MGGAVAVIGSAESLAARAERACVRRGVSVAVSAWVGDGFADLGAAVDSVARRDDVTAVLLHAAGVDDHRRLAAVLRAVTPHLPVVFASAAEPLADPWFGPWLASLGVISCGTSSQAADGLAAAGTLDPPGDGVCLVAGHDAPAVEATAAAVASAGVSVEARVGLSIEAALADLSHDLVVLVIREAEARAADVLDALDHARRRHADLPLVVVADGSAEWESSVRGGATGRHIDVVPGDVDLGAGIRLLAAWDAARRRLARGDLRARDSGRLRRVVRDLRAGGATLLSPAAQGELCGALGLPFPGHRAVPYREDALICAAELGYPVRLAAVHEHMAWPDVPEWALAETSDDLLDLADQRLAAVQKTAGRRAELLLVPAVRATSPVIVVARRHENYGAIAEVETGGRTVHVVAPFDAQMLVVATGVSGPPADGIVTAADAALAALAEVEDIEAIEVAVDIGSSGFLARHVSLSLRGR